MLLQAGISYESIRWSGWELEPGVVAPIVLSAMIYARGYTRLLSRSRRARRVLERRAFAFAAGEVALFLALASPLDGVADELFSAHMVQHLVLILVAAPLLVFGAPIAPMLWGLPARWRRRVVTLWRSSRALRGTWSMLTAPGVVFVLHAVALWTWHFPGPYEAALRSDVLHALEHTSFFGTALLFWWLVIQPVGHRRLSYAASLLFVGGTLIYSGALGALLMFSPTAWYPVHIAGAAKWGMTALADQQLAGLIMWIPAGFVYVGAACALFLAWMRADEVATVSRQSRRPTDAVA